MRPSHTFRALLTALLTIGFALPANPHSEAITTQVPEARLNGGNEGRTPETDSASHRGTSIDGGTPGQQELVRDALDRFAELGLELPPLEILIGSSYSECGGYRGMFWRSSDPTQRWQVDICAVEILVVLHELGHAWVAATLSDEERDDYLEAWGLESWGDPATPWRSRGTEHAANLIAWGLHPRPIGCPLAEGTLARSVEGFQRLTGQHAPRVQCERLAVEDLTAVRAEGLPGPAS